MRPSYSFVGRASWNQMCNIDAIDWPLNRVARFSWLVDVFWCDWLMIVHSGRRSGREHSSRLHGAEARYWWEESIFLSWFEAIGSHFFLDFWKVNSLNRIPDTRWVKWASDFLFSFWFRIPHPRRHPPLPFPSIIRLWESMFQKSHFAGHFDRIE